MKTILLTSAGTHVMDEILKILPKEPQEIKLAHIITAAKGEKNTAYVDRERVGLSKAGFQITDIDIEGQTEKNLRKLLESFNVIYVQGGNSFYLLKCAKESGFDKIAKDLVEKGVVYIGVSAGSYIACPTIEMANWKHQDRNIVGLTDLAGLGLVPFLLSVHYKTEYKEILQNEISTAKYPVRILTDDQAILIKDNNITLVGKGSEIKF